MRKIAMLLLALLALSSCIGIDSTLAIRPDGSGTLSLAYRVSQFTADLGKAGTEKGTVPLPVSREDFERGLLGVPGVSLVSFQKASDEKDITVRAELSFDKVESLAKVSAFQDAPPTITVSGSKHTFSQLVVKAAPEPPSADVQQMVDSFFDGYAVTLTFRTPSPIELSSAGVLSPDKKQLTYKATVKELITTRKDVVVSFTW
jgi:hypothetical protein